MFGRQKKKKKKIRQGTEKNNIKIRKCEEMRVCETLKQSERERERETFNY